jgi:hypothetical protein
MADYYKLKEDAKAQARESDNARYGMTAASTPTDSARYPTQRYSVMGGAVSPNFQTSSALIRDLGGGGAKPRGYAIGDTLPDGSNIQDITTGRDGSVQVSVILPDGREAMLGSRQPAPSPRPTTMRGAEGIEIPKTAAASGGKYLKNIQPIMDELGLGETFEPSEDDEPAESPGPMEKSDTRERLGQMLDDMRSAQKKNYKVDFPR